MVLDVTPRIMIVDRIQSFVEPWPTCAKDRGWQVYVAHGIPNPEMCCQMDVIHCNWGDGYAVQMSQRRWPGKLSVTIVSYEAYAGFLREMNWDNVDLVIFASPHIRDYVQLTYEDFPADMPIHFVPDCIDVEKFPLKKDLSPGNRIACVGRIAEPKNCQFLINAAYEFPEYEFCLKGPFADLRLQPFFAYHNARLDNLHVEGPSGPEGSAWFSGEGVDEFLESCHYIASPSFHECTHLALLEGMAKGLVPLVQDRPGAVYPDTYSSISEFALKLERGRPSEKYREWVVANRDVSRRVAAVDEALDALAPSPIITP